MASATPTRRASCLPATAHAITAGPPMPARPNSLYYVVKEGDSIGQVLNELGVCPLWGKNKNVEKTLNLNELPNDSAARLLPPGKKIKLAVDHLTIPEPEYRIEGREIIRLIEGTRAYCKKGFVAPLPVTKKLLQVFMSAKSCV